MNASARVNEVVEDLCRELGVDPRNVKQIQIDEAGIWVEAYVLAEDGENIDHRLAPATNGVQFLWRVRVVGMAKGDAKRRVSKT